MNDRVINLLERTKDELETLIEHAYIEGVHVTEDLKDEIEELLLELKNE
jgi:predicted nucleotide-binding protein (sugar kinase/HSP70/actin superfamily)